MNVSEWRLGESEGEDVVEVVQEGKMPPLLYVIMRPSVRLSPAEKQLFIKGLAATFGGEEEETEREGGQVTLGSEGGKEKEGGRMNGLFQKMDDDEDDD